MAKTTYNRAIRKIIVAFGDLFDNITLTRYDENMMEYEHILVPITYASKERYVMRIQADPDLDKKVMMTLPRMSYEMNGISYDSSRKQNTNVKNFAQTPTGLISQYNPVPYNFDFSLYLYVRNIEDGTQIIEHILPFFTPDYTVKVNMIPEMGIIKELPVVLNSTTYEVDYEGDRDHDTRSVIWTLNFTVKGYIFGQASSSSIITHSITSIYQMITDQDAVEFSINHASGTGTYKISEMVYQGHSPSTSIATAIVSDIHGNKLTLTNINGNFISSRPIIGLQSNASYTFSSYNFVPQKYVEIDVYPNPEIANTIPVQQIVPVVDYGSIATPNTSSTIIDFGSINTANNYTVNTIITEYNITD